MKKFIFALCVGLTLGSQPAYAEESSAAVLENLEGKFRGRGIAVLPMSGREERVSCQIDNAFDNVSNKLTIGGRCATTQGKIQISGKLVAKEDGSLEGVFISPSESIELTKSEVELVGNAITISMETFDKTKNKINRSKQIIKFDQENAGFSSSFEMFDDEKGAYLPIGTLEFKPKSK